MQSVIEVLTSLSAPYLLSEGSLLHLYRNCDVGLSDLDISLDQGWWETNWKKVEKLLKDAGFGRTLVFGSFGSFGYEESWEKDGIKVDIFGSVTKDKIRVIGFWVGENLYACSMPLQKEVVYRWRDTLDVRIPLPLEEALIAMYGRNYKYPMNDWVWQVHPFLTGYCSYQRIENS